MIEKIIQQLIVDEGMVLKPYYCPAGYLTVGIGRNLEGNGLSWGEMVSLIKNNLDRKKRFPPDFEKIEGETLLLALIRDMKLNGITEDEAMMLLNNDIYQCEQDLKRTIKWYDDAPEEVREVLINMCFNMGIKTLKKFKNTLWYMGAGEYQKAAENMLKSKWARQVKSRAVRLAERIKNIR
jgi:lysozyme